jgi:hypothetical protein
MIRYSRSRAREYLLSYQHLFPPRRLTGDDDILGFIRKVGCIQYDPLRTTARNADLVLQSRCMGYSEETLHRLLYEKRRLIDWWDKNMAIRPIEDWPFLARERERFQRKYADRAKELERARVRILALFEKRDYLSSRDLGDGKKVSWAWAPTTLSRAALESMYHRGELVIHHKAGSRKFYAPAVEVVPSELLEASDPFRDLEDYHDWLVKRRIAAVGLLWNRSGDAWLGTRLKKHERAAALSRLEERGEIAKVEVEDIEEPLYLPAWELARLENPEAAGPGATPPGKRDSIEASKNSGPEAALLAPLDNLLWDRKLTAKLFDFDYKWEVYTPVKERRYGYYVLPVLCGSDFIGRCEPVLDRASGTLNIKNWWWERNGKPTDESEKALAGCLREFCRFLGAVDLSLPGELKLPEVYHGTQAR